MGSKSKPPMHPRLVVIEGPEKGRVVPLKAGTVVIGRSKGDVIIQDPRISRSHVAVHVDERSFKVTFTDLKSLNGVQHNGENRETGEIKDGDRLQLGNTTFDCQTGVQEDSATEPAIALKKRRQDPERAERTDVSELSEMESSYRSEPTSLGEPVFGVESTTDEPKVIQFYRRLSGRTKLYGSIAVGLIVVLLALPSGKPKTSAPTVERDFSSIRQLEAQGKLNEASAKLEQMRVDAPTHPEIHRMLGDLYFKQRAWEQSLDAYKRSFDLDSKQIEILPKLARIHLTMNNVAGAQSVNGEIDHFLAKSPESPEFFVSVANLYLDYPKLELRPEKMVIIGQAIQNKYAPDDPAGYKLEALGHIERGQSEDAFGVLEKAKIKFPTEESLYPYLVLGKVRVKDIEGANQTVQQWIDLFPKSVQALTLMGQLRYQTKDSDGALQYLQKAVQVGGSERSDPHYPKAVYLLGELYYELNETVEAENSLRTACELGVSEGCEHVLIKGGSRTPQSKGKPLVISPPQKRE